MEEVQDVVSVGGLNGGIIEFFLITRYGCYLPLPKRFTDDLFIPGKLR
jgi:hypothetical protein